MVINYTEDMPIAKRRYCLALDLKDDPESIATYKKHHANVWPEVLQSLQESGIENMEIYLVGNRLFMIIHVSEAFTFEAKAQSDAQNPIVQKWETLMWEYQQALPTAKEGEKWLLMEKIFEWTKN